MFLTESAEMLLSREDTQIFLTVLLLFWKSFGAPCIATFPSIHSLSPSPGWDTSASLRKRPKPLPLTSPGRPVFLL